ncbi:MAG: hypothetical protein CMG76_00820 [Candidatus Marinimicrobia bacterium]|nr:hypothetical protein [Candidatus Neomarinimicrobiota bacterium]
MKENHITLKCFSIIFYLISLVFTQEGSFKSGNIKYDVNNLEYIYSDRLVDVSFKLGKFSISNSSQSVIVSNNGYTDISLGPSKIQIQNMFIDVLNKNNRENIEFDLGSFRFDVNKFDFEMNDIYKPDLEDLVFNMKLTASNIILDLSQIKSFPPDVQQIFEQIGTIDELTLNRATINTSYNSSKLFRFNVDGMTNLANVKITVSAIVNEMFPEKTQFQACSLTLNNLSPELNKMVSMIQTQTGFPIPMTNGSITFDVKDMLNAGQNPFGGF